MSKTIRKIWRKQGGKFFCLSTRVPGVDNTWKDHFFRTDEFFEMPKWIEEHSHLDIYFCPHGFNRRSRTVDEAVPPQLLWADLDEVHPELIPDKLQPTVAIQSSEGRFVGLWVITDKPMTLELNKRLNHHICPESHSSWIFTKALRLPGTRNYKYKPPQKVTLLWDDGPKYTYKQLDQLLPNLDESSVSGNTAREVFNKYRKWIPVAVQREMFGTAAVPGKRSEMMWKIIMSFVEAGADEEEIFEVVKVSRWNKFNGMRNEDRSIRRQIAKAFSQKLADKPKKVKKRHQKDEQYEDDERPDWLDKEDPTEDDDDDDQPFHFNIQSLEDVEERDIDWLWPGKIPLGELTILEGDPGVGKSFFTHWLSAQVCDGKRLPTEYPSGVKPIKGNVVYFDFENDSGTTTKKRVKAAGCKNMSKFYQIEDPFVMGEKKFDNALDELMEKVDPQLVIFDTLNHYLGAKGDINNSKDATQALAPFHKFARKYHCAVVVLRHLNKSDGKKAIYRGQGNIAQTGVARVVLSAAKLDNATDEFEGEGWVGLGTTKNNLSALGKTLVYKIEFDPHNPKGHDDKAHVVIQGFIDKTADEILAPSDEKKRGAKDKEMSDAQAAEAAQAFLLELLNDGSVMTRAEIIELAEKKGLTQQDVYIASRELPIRKKKGEWWLETK